MNIDEEGIELNMEAYKPSNGTQSEKVKKYFGIYSSF